MKILLIIFLVSPFNFTHAYFDETTPSPFEPLDQSINDADAQEWIIEDGLNESDPFLELGGSENINYSQDHYYEEDSEIFNENNDP